MTAQAIHRTKAILAQAEVIGHGPGPTLTIIENPSLEHCIGILLAKHYDKFPLSRFRDIFYVRVEVDTGELKAKEKHAEARIHTSEVMGFRYNFIAVDYGKSTERAFQAGSVRPYCICHIPMNAYSQFVSDGVWEKYALDAVTSASMLAARISSIFSLKEEKIVMPEDYAAVRMGSS